MTYQVEAEFTDTFGGEPNYSWVKRATLTVPTGTSDRAIWRRLKAAMGLNGVRGRAYSNGDSWEFRPARSCTVLLARVVY